MKISTRLKIAALAPTMMAVVIGSALLFSYSSVRKTQANSKTVGNIVSNTNELSSLTTEYILYRENRPKQQFLEVHDSIMRLTAIRFRNPEQQQLLDTIVGNSESMKGLFQKLVSNYDLFPPDKSDTRLREAEQRLAGQLILRLRQVGADASRLQMLTHDEITATQTRTNTLIIFVIVISALPLTFVLSRTRKSITSSLTTFRRGTEVVASGNLTHRIGIAARDEIGELSRAFDVMTEQLGYITVSRDELSREVEERKLAEEALLEQREWLRVTLTSIGDAVIATDTFGLVTFLNPVAGELTGWQSEEANGQPIQSVFRIINEQTRKASENVVERVLREGNIVNLANHTALMTRDGREIPIEDSAAPIRDKDGELTGVVLVFHNVTEKRRAQEALLESQQKNEFLADIIRISSQPFVVGYPDGRLGLVNSAFEHLTGYSSDELQSTDWAIDLTPSEWLPLERQKMEEQILTGKPIRYEKEYIRKDGSRVPIELLVHLVTDSDGRPQYYYSFLTDITEHKQMDEELRKSRDELELRVHERTAELKTYMAKLEESNQALQDFAAIASHDLQEPLRKVAAFGNMLKKNNGGSLGEQGNDYLERMLN
ncbi:MAG: PAS domain S-box protein, partial [Syntrophobacteraceae bacterium]